MMEDPVADNVDVQMDDDESIGGRVDFTIKTARTDAVFLVEGRRIYAGSDFLCLISPYFTALLRGVFAEMNGQEEVELKDVAYDDFLEMLHCLVDPSREIKAEKALSLLSLGDLYGIKSLVDRVEESMLANRKHFTIPLKLLQADRYRLIKMQTSCVDAMGADRHHTMTRHIMNCPEFKQMSQSAKQVFREVAKEKVVVEGFIREKVYEVFTNPLVLEEVKNVKEPENGFVASGSLAVRYPSFHNKSIDVGGLLWKVVTGKKLKPTNDDPLPCYPAYLVINQDRPSSEEWAVEGFVEVVVAKVDKTTKAEQWREGRTFAFSLSSSHRVGQLRNWPTEHSKFRVDIFTSQITIHVTSISGVRKCTPYDFTLRSEMASAGLRVGGRKIFVNKQYLTTVVPRFNEMFYGKNEVEVKGVEYEDFIEFLHWVYPSARRNTTVSAMFSVLTVATKLGTKMFHPEVHQQLAQSDEDAILPDRVIFFFEFACDGQAWFRYVMPNGYGTVAQGRVHISRLKESKVFALMSPCRKIAMMQWMLEQQQ